MSYLPKTERIYESLKYWAGHPDIYDKVCTAVCDIESENMRLRETLKEVCKALGNGATCSSDSSIEFLEGIPKEVRLVIEGLKKEIDEADRRAGCAERQLSYVQDSTNRRKEWLRKAKQEWGVSENVSFDVVWEEALKLKKRGLVISSSNHSTFGYDENDDSLKGPFAVVE